MKFTQIVEFKTSSIDELDNYFDAWIVRTTGKRVPHRAVIAKDRHAANTYLLIVEFDSHEQGVENSNRPATAEFAEFLAGISDGQPDFRSLDVLRDNDL